MTFLHINSNPLSEIKMPKAFLNMLLPLPLLLFIDALDVPYILPMLGLTFLHFLNLPFITNLYAFLYNFSYHLISYLLSSTNLISISHFSKTNSFCSKHVVKSTPTTYFLSYFPISIPTFTFYFLFPDSLTYFFF